MGVAEDESQPIDGSALPPTPNPEDPKYWEWTTDENGDRVRVENSFLHELYNEDVEKWEQLVNQYEQDNERVRQLLESKSALREEMSMLQDELTDWVQGETKIITYTIPHFIEDGSITMTEHTVVLTVDEALDLMEEMNQLLESIGAKIDAIMMKWGQYGKYETAA